MPWQNATQLSDFHVTINAQAGLTTAEADSLHAAADAIPVDPPPPQPWVLVCDGDSLTQGVSPATPYPALLASNLGRAVNNQGVGGEQWAQILVGGSDVDVLFNGAAPKNIVAIWGGTNDLFWERTPQQLWDDLATYCTARRAAGFKVVVLPVIAREQSGLPASFESNRQAYNAMLRANWATIADALSDVDGDTRLQNALDTTYFADGVHLTTVGNQIVADYVADAMLGT